MVLIIASLFVLAVVMVGVLTIGRAPGGRRKVPKSVSGMAERENAVSVQALIEESDIQQMIEARNDLRRRLGKPTIGDELIEQALGRR